MKTELIEVKGAEKKFNFEINSYKEALEFAKQLSDSELVPRDYRGKPANTLAAIQYGAEIGLKPLQALQGIAIINNKPCLWGDSMLALVIGNPLCEYVMEKFKDGIAYCTVKRKGDPDQYTFHFSKDNAKQAGLLNKQGVWTQYPERMLQMRARGFALRDKFPDVLKGISMAEEVQDYQLVENIQEKQNKKSVAEDKINNLISHKAEINNEDNLSYKIENATSIEDLKILQAEAKKLLKEKHTELTEATNTLDNKKKNIAELVRTQLEKALSLETVQLAADLIRDCPEESQEELINFYHQRCNEFETAL